MRKYYAMRKYYFIGPLLLLFNIAHAPSANAQILASPVFDVANNVIGGIAKVVANASRAIREDILPWQERISKVQTFFRKASQKVNVVVKNLQMVNDLIELENKINKLFSKSIQDLDRAESFEDKWKHRIILYQIYKQSLDIFNVFDIAIQEQGTMDDENRIILVRDSLKKARRVYTSLRVAVRRTNKAFYNIERTKKELEVFDRLFGDP